MLEGSAITALLGPTNTGKTHRAVERMLTYDTGMLGVPLRLLAREIYDRLTAQIGEERVALVTGEEKRIPRRPAYWVSTVEAMPIEREVDFLAVDEIQLAEDEQRGHVFTERLLSARGRRETWFLGAETMRGAIAELVPSARVVTHPRLSKLTFRGMERLGKLPPRSACVAFSASQVFELGERLRGSKGGVAVVMGALSPRTRNAQVAMFQSGEVEHLVATDAIGMGLNLHVSHVAFAALRKFDGKNVRELTAAELGQIAGRAGRHLNDGTFGTIDPVHLPDDVARAIETHHFAPVKRLQWRSAELDFASVDRLLQSLRERPRSRWLRLADHAEDTMSLELLAGDERVRRLCRDASSVRLLWDVCRIPDFRKLLLEAHVELLTEVFFELCSPEGALGDDWMESRVRTIDDVAGEVETLTDRLAKIRTLTFIANHARWVSHAGEWQARTRGVEDRLSDALHDRLVQRFVERGGKRRHGVSKPRARTTKREEEAPTIAPDHPFARLRELRTALAPGPPPALEPGEDAWVEALIAAPHDALSIDAAGCVHWSERLVARLVPGSRIVLPEVRLVRLDDLGAGARARLVRRLTAFARDAVTELLGPLHGPDAQSLSAASRGIVYQLEQGLGTALAREARAQLEVLTDADRAALEGLGVVLGAFVVFLPRLLSRASLARRLSLVGPHYSPSPRPPSPGAVSIPYQNDVDERAYLALGYPVCGPRAVRADVAERVAAALRDRGEGVSTQTFAHWMGCSRHAAERVVEALVAGPVDP